MEGLLLGGSDMPPRLATHDGVHGRLVQAVRPCESVLRLAAQCVPGVAAYTWIVWCIGGLILLILALRLFSPLLRG